MFLGRLFCWYKGKHLRGKLVYADQEKQIYQCGRCGRQRTYRNRKKVTPMEEPK